MPDILLIILGSIILFQLLFSIVFLLSVPQGKKTSNRLLAAFFLLLWLNLLDGILSFTEFYLRYPALAHLEDGFIFLLGPVLYFYTLSLTLKDFSFGKRHAVHFIPFVAVTLLFQFYYHRQSAPYQQFIQQAIVQQDLPVTFYVTALIIYAHVISYIGAAIFRVHQYRTKIRDQFSSVVKINLEWLTFMLYTIAVVLMISIVTTFSPITGLKQYHVVFFFISLLFLLMFVTVILWKSIQQPLLFSGIKDEPVSKYQGSFLTETEKSEIRQQVERVMDIQKLYLQPELTLEQLAEVIHTSPRKLSQVINELFKQNFYDFINSYRIDEAKRILSDVTHHKLTILEVMYLCGFNSKSSFNTIFKTKTGMTPTLFRKQSLESERK